MKRLHDLFGTLRKRRIVQVGLVYLGGAFALLETIGFLQDNYGLSHKLVDVALLLVVLGFPAVLVVTWYHGEKGHQQVVRTEISLLVTLAVLAAIGTYRISTGEEVPSDEPAIEGQASATRLASATDLGARSLVVLPFLNNTIDEDLTWLGPGVADMLTTNFAQLSELTVVSRQRLFDLLRQTGSDETENIPEDLASEVATRAGAHLMVRGSIVGSRDDLTLDAQLLELASGTVIAAARARGNDVFSLVDSVTHELSAALLGGPLEPTEMAPLAQLTTPDLEAYREYQAGLRAARLDRPEVAREHFERAADIDSTFVLPLVRLAVQSSEAAAATGDAEVEAQVYEVRAQAALAERARRLPPGLERAVMVSVDAGDSLIVMRVDSIVQVALQVQEEALAELADEMARLRELGQIDSVMMLRDSLWRAVMEPPAQHLPPPDAPLPGGGPRPGAQPSNGGRPGPGTPPP